MRKALKRTLGFLLAVGIAFGAAGCGSSGTEEIDSADASNVTSTDISSIVSSDTTSSTESRLSDTYDDIIFSGTDPVGIDAVTVAEEDLAYTIISTEDDLTVDSVAEISVDYITVGEKVTPTVIPENNSYYYYEADEGYQYVDVCIAYTNLQDEEISLDDVIDATLLCGWATTYSPIIVLETDGRTNLTTRTEVAAKEATYAHIAFKVKEKYTTNGKALQMIFELGGNYYMWMLNEPTNAGNLKTNAGEVETTSDGTIAVGEKIQSSGKYEIYIVYANITRIVYPPLPLGVIVGTSIADSGNVYVDVYIAYTNLSGIDMEWSTFSLSSDLSITGGTLYGGNNYSGILFAESEDRTDLTASYNITLSNDEKVYMHMLFEVPEEILMDGEAVTVNFGIDGEQYTYNYR